MAPFFTGIAKNLGGYGFGRLQQVEGPSSRSVTIYLWGATGNGGRGGSAYAGGFTTIQGTTSIGTTLTYIVGTKDSAGNFYTGGSVGNNSSGGFSAIFVGPNVGPGPGRSFALGVAGGGGASGYDHYTAAYGGSGGGTTGGSGSGSPSGGHGTGGSGPAWIGAAGGGSGGGGGGGGWFGGGAGAGPGSYAPDSAAAGGGGSGYVAPAGNKTNGTDSFNLTTGATYNGGPGAVYTNPTGYPDSPGATGKVVILVDGVAVVDTTSAPPGAATVNYTIV
jgi:hypothetical protein